MKSDTSEAIKLRLQKQLDNIEKQLEKIRGASPLTHGWQTQKLAKAQRKWDFLAIKKQELKKQIEDIEEK